MKTSLATLSRNLGKEKDCCHLRTAGEVKLAIDDEEERVFFSRIDEERDFVEVFSPSASLLAAGATPVCLFA